jgi:serine/threonine-protein kinase
MKSVNVEITLKAFGGKGRKMADRIGQQLGSYRLTRLLGQGGFADVYLGEHIYLKTRAAVKVLQTRLSNESDLESFLNEARTIAHLSHPNIVRVLDFGVADETLFLVTDYAPNGTLRQRHPKGIPLPMTTIIPYVKHISNALQYAHNRKLIHRDVKPENILLGARNEVLLSDFGIALIAQSSRHQNMEDVVGTVAYMSPEQIQGKPRAASDQYSLGLVVYEWLSGDRPFQGTFTELCTQHMFAPPPPLREKVPTIDPAIEQVVTIALAKDPKQRFVNITAFANALEQAANGQRVPPTEPADRSLVISTPPLIRQTPGSKAEALVRALSETEAARLEPTVHSEDLPASRQAPSSKAEALMRALSETEVARLEPTVHSEDLPASRQASGQRPQALARGLRDTEEVRLEPTERAHGLPFSFRRVPTLALRPILQESPRNVASPSLQKRRPNTRSSLLVGGGVALILFLVGFLIIRLIPFVPSWASPVTPTPSPDQIVPKWAFPTGDVVDSSPTVANGVVYVGSNDGKVYAIDANTGQQKWAFATHNIVYSSPMVVNGVVYVGSNDGKVYALDASTGQQKWAFATNGNVDSSPTVVNGVVYVGSHDNNVYAIDANTGQFKWAFHTGDAVWSSPTVVDGVVYVGSDDHDVYAIDASTGQEKWTFRTGDGAPSSPTVVGGVVYFGSSDRNVYALDASTGQQRWVVPIGDGAPSSLRVVDGVLYFGSHDHNVYALDASTGQQKWTFPTGDVVEASPRVVDGVLYVGSNDGKVYALDASTGQEKWTFHTGSAVDSSSIVVNGVLYVGSRDHSVYALPLPTSSP